VDPGVRSPLIDFFRRGEVARDVRMLAAQGALAPRALEQLALLILLVDDADRDIAAAAAETVDALPADTLRLFLARDEVTPEMRAFFAARGLEPAVGVAPPAELGEDPFLDTLSELPEEPGPPDAEHKLLTSLPVIDRMKLAMKGTREQRAQLIRDTNRIVSAAVLSSPKLTETEVESFTKMGNVSEDVLRTIGHRRAWLKNYGVVLGLCRHPKTPPAISMQLIHRLNDKDLKALMTDRNIREGLRVLAKKIVTKGQMG